MKNQNGQKDQQGAKSGSAPENAGTKVAVRASIPLFYEQKDGNDFPYRIANMNNPLVCPRKGVIQIEATKRGPHKQAGISICNVYDSKLRVWYGVPVGINPVTKQILWKRFQIPEFREYNLANEEDAIEWAIISRAEFIQGSLLKQGRVLFRKYDVEGEAEKEVKQISLIEEAIGIVRTMKLKDWINAARYLGKTPEGLSAVKLQSEIYKVAKNTPMEIIEYWSNNNREIIDLFNTAKAVGLITHDIVNGWMHKRTLPIGRTEQLAIAYILKDTMFASALKADVTEKDKALAIVRGRTPSDDVDMNNFDNQQNEELVELQMKAQLLGVKGYDVMESDELRKRVEEVEAEAEIAVE